MSAQPDPGEQLPSLSENRRAFFSDFGPEHRLWAHVERGTQIVTGLFMITMAGFLGESWGNEDVPYASILRALAWVGYSFLLITLMTPATLFVVIFLRRLTRLDRYQRGMVYFIILMAAGIYCWFNLYAATIDVLRAIAESRDIPLDFGEAYYPQPWRE